MEGACTGVMDYEDPLTMTCKMCAAAALEKLHGSCSFLKLTNQSLFHFVKIMKGLTAFIRCCCRYSFILGPICISISFHNVRIKSRLKTLLFTLRNSE